MKVFMCSRCDRLQNEQQFQYRHGIGVRRHLVCKMCRYPEGGEVECKTQLCPECLLPSPRSNFCVFFQGQDPILKESCTSCRFKAGEQDTISSIESEHRPFERSAIIEATLTAWEKEYAKEPQPSLLQRAREWILHLIRKRP
jgi:hypothetical protein